MEEFRDIRNYAKIALNENAPMTYLIKEWKDDIRDMLQTVQEDFIRMIRDYTRKFYNSLVKIEQQSVKLLPFENEDTRQWERLETMKVKYEQIEAIIKRVDATAPNHKAQVTREVNDQMRRLEQDLIAKDKEMKMIS